MYHKSVLSVVFFVSYICIIVSTSLWWMLCNLKVVAWSLMIQWFWGMWIFFPTINECNALFCFVAILSSHDHAFEPCYICLDCGGWWDVIDYQDGYRSWKHSQIWLWSWRICCKGLIMSSSQYAADIFVACVATTTNQFGFPEALWAFHFKSMMSSRLLGC